MQKAKRRFQSNAKVETAVMFGSEISFRSSVDSNHYLYSDGFIDTSLISLDLDLGEADHNNFGKQAA
jgi:hypothetical protein